MTSYVTRESALARLTLAERDEESPPLGGTLRLRELTRAQLRACGGWATTEDMAEREKARGVALATADLADDEARARALTAYWLGAPATTTDADRWHAALFAAMVVDPETKEPIFDRDQILTWPNRIELWNEVRRIAQMGLDLSEVGAEALRKSDPEAPAE